MNNFELALVYDSGMPIPFQFDNGRDAVQWLGGDGEGEQVRRISITAIADDGRKILITISNDPSTKASIRIEDDVVH
jgi:hypothetical protein